MRAVVLAMTLPLAFGIAACTGEDSTPAAQPGTTSPTTTEASGDNLLAPTATPPRIRCDVSYRPSYSKPTIRRATVALDKWGATKTLKFRRLQIQFTRSSDDPGGQFAPTLGVRAGAPDVPLGRGQDYYFAGFGLPYWRERNLLNQLWGSPNGANFTGQQSITAPGTRTFLSFTCRSLDAPDID